MKQVIIVGGSQSHLPFIEAAKNLGYKTIVFDIDKNCKGAKQSESFYQISTHDIDKIISKCFEINREEKIAGVMTYSSSTQSLFAVARTCEILGLPSFSLKSAELATNKKLMKECFSDNGISTPEWIETNDINDAVDFANETNERLIIKPSSGSQGSKGVFLINQEYDISKYFDIAKGNSHNLKVILEKYYIGREFSVDGIVVDDKPAILSVSEKFNLGPEFNFTMCGFSMGEIANKDKELLREMASIKAAGKRAAVAMGISNSFFSVDVLLTTSGPLVLECGILLDCKIDRLLYAAGVNVYEMYIKIITGMKIIVKEPDHTCGYGLAFIFADKKGLISFNVDRKTDNGKTVEWERKHGDSTSPPNSVADILGWVISKGVDGYTAYEDARGFAQSDLFKVNT